MKRIKNTVLKGITAIMVLSLFLGIGATEITLHSALMVFIPLIWIFLFAKANKDLYE